MAKETSKKKTGKKSASVRELAEGLNKNLNKFKRDIESSNAPLKKMVAEVTKNTKAMQREADKMLAFSKNICKTTKRWTEAHNALFGIGGMCGQVFKTESLRIAFSKTPQYAAIQELIGGLQRDDTEDEDFPAMLAGANGKILVRLPRSIHAALLVEAKAEGVSLNQLILAKLAMQLRAVV